MPTQIVASRLNGNGALAMVETMALALVAILLLLLLRRTEGDDVPVALGKGTAPRRRRLRQRRGAYRCGLRRWALAVLLLLPHLTLVLVSLVPYSTWTTQALPPELSLVNYQSMFGESARLRPCSTHSGWRLRAQRVRWCSR